MILTPCSLHGASPRTHWSPLELLWQEAALDSDSDDELMGLSSNPKKAGATSSAPVITARGRVSTLVLPQATASHIKLCDSAQSHAAGRGTS